MPQYDYASELLGTQSDEPEAQPYDYAEEFVSGLSSQNGPEAQTKPIPTVPDDQIEGSVANRVLDAPGKGFIDRQVSSAKTALGFFLNNDEKARADVIRKNFPSAQFARDEQGRLLVRGSDQETYAYINAPGIDRQDITDVAGDIVKFAPAARLGGLGVGLASRAAITGGASLVTSGVSDAAAGLAGSKQGVDYGKAAIAGAAGAGGEVISTGLATGARSLGKLLKQAHGKSTNLAQIADDAARVIDEEAVTRARLSARGAQAADDLAQGFDIRLSRGQATGDVGEQAFESAALRGAKGSSAQQTLEGFSKGQTDDIQRAGAKLAGARSTADQKEAARLVRDGLTRRAALLDDEIDRAYQAARDMQATLDIDGLKDLQRAMIRSAPEELTAESILATPKRLAKDYPYSTAVLSEMKGLQKRIAAVESRTSAKLTSVDFREIERYRRTLNASIDNSQARSADRRALMMMKASFDGWIDDAFARNLFSGDEAFIETMKRARGLRAEYGRLYQNDGAKDFAGKVIDDIIRNDPTPEETVNLLFGSGRLGAKRGAAETVKQIKEITKGGEEWQALREAAVDKIMAPGFGRGGDQLRIGTLIESWESALIGDGQSVMTEMFTAQELKRMRQFVMVLKRVEPKPGAVNNSGTAYEIARQMREMLGNVVRVPNLGATRILTGAVDPNAIRATQAVAGAPRPLPSLPGPSAAVLPAINPAFNEVRKEEERP